MRGPRKSYRPLWIAAALFSSFMPGNALATNQLTNPSFENGITGWNVVSSSATVISYDTPGFPTSAVANKIGGGFQLLRDVGGNAVIEQSVSLAATPPGMNLHVGGYFGAGNEDAARLVIRFLTAGGTEILRPLESVTQLNRNYESVLMLREAILAIPPGSVTAVARIEFINTGSGAADAAADALFMEAVSTSLTPPPLPFDTELLNNPGFEAGWSFGSPLSLTDPRGWEGANSRVVVKPYSDVDSTVPSMNVSCVIGGGNPSTSCASGGAGNLLSDESGNGVLRQRLDVRGNASQFSSGSVALRVSAFLGGVGGEPDTARIDVRFLNESFFNITPLSPVGPVSSTNRNGETVVVNRVAEYVITNPATAYVEIAVAFTNTGSGSARGLADNISAMLVTPSTPTPTTLNSNLIQNGHFESGSLYGSPLQLTNSKGWSGTFGGTVEVIPYGQGSNTPPTSFANSKGLGGLLLGDLSGYGIIRQVLDVSADAALINQGRLRLVLSAWLGGVGSEQDTAEVLVTFTNAAGSQVGTLQQIGPVTASDRGNQTTLLPRDGDFLIPTSTAKISIDVIFTNTSSGAALALADNISAVVYDTLLGGPVKFPGTGEDLRLLTGINTVPTTGPGHDVKTASPLDVLNVNVESPNGTFHFFPLILAANVVPTGMAPSIPAGLPGLWLNPFQLVLLFDGFGCTGFGCSVVIPGGTQANFLIPNGLSGNTLFLQGFVLPNPLGSTANGIYAATEAHEIVLQ